MLYYYTVLLDYTSLLVPEKQYGKYVQIPSIQKMAGKIKWTLFYPKRSQKELWMTGKCHNWLHRSHNSRNIAIFILYLYYTHLSKLLPTLTMWFWMQLLSLIKMKLAPSFISVSRPQRTTEDFSFIITLMLLQCLSFCLAGSFGHCNWIFFLTEDNIQAKLLFFIILFICWLTV